MTPRQYSQFKVRKALKGQSLVEGAIVFLAFFAMLFAIFDCAQVLIAHQAMVERVRASVRWGVLHPWDGTGEQVANLVLYDQIEAPRARTDGYLGLARENIVVHYTPSTASRPDDETISVAIVNYHHHFMSPWVTSHVVSLRPVFEAAPMAYRATASADLATQ